MAAGIKSGDATHRMVGLDRTREWGSFTLSIPVSQPRASLASVAIESIGEIVSECYSELAKAINADTEYMTLLVEGYSVWRKRFLLPRIKAALAARRLSRGR